MPPPKIAFRVNQPVKAQKKPGNASFAAGMSSNSPSMETQTPKKRKRQGNANAKTHGHGRLQGRATMQTEFLASKLRLPIIFSQLQKRADGSLNGTFVLFLQHPEQMRLFRKGKHFPQRRFAVEIHY